MVTCFERARTALDALMERASKFITGSLDERVAAACRQLRLAYGTGLLNRGREPVNYSRPETHLAYIYRTLPAHADWVYKALRTAPLALQDACSGEPIRVVCVGGGPGSEMVGFMKFLEAGGRGRAVVEFIILDREKGWNVPRREITKTLGRNVTQQFQELDLANTQKRWTENWSFASANVFILSFCLSEVWCYNGSGAVSDFLSALVRRAPRGAVFVYVDNGGECTNIADSVFSAIQSLTLVASRDDPSMRMGAEEQRAILEDEYCARFKNERVKMGGNVSSRIWRKS